MFFPIFTFSQLKLHEELVLLCICGLSFSLSFAGLIPIKFHIQIPLPPKIDPSVTMITVEEKPDVTYNDGCGCKEQIEKMLELRIAFNFFMLFFILMYFFLW